MQEDKIKSDLIYKLKENNSLWSYNQDTIKDIPDDLLVELVMLHLDMDDINKLFQIMPQKNIKKAWLKNVVSQGEMYYNLNAFFAWYYFDAKRPRQYVKSMATKLLNKRS